MGAVSLQDERYKGKVVIVSILGSWCPNCLDEAEFLAPWYKANKQRQTKRQRKVSRGLCSLHFPFYRKKGWGRKTTAGTVTAKSTALKLLSYYDIYKNYYANVQQTEAYIVGASLGFTNGTATGATPNSFTDLKK